MSNTIILIPSRMSAQRLPGKPLLEVNGLPIICHVVKKAQETQIGDVIVATEDQEILNQVKKHKGDAILTSKNEIKYFNNTKNFYTLIVKPNFGCSTREIYSRVKKFHKSKLNQPKKKMFSLNYLKKMSNDLEKVAFIKYPKLKIIKLYLENSLDPAFVRMTGSGSSLVAYFQSKKSCERGKKRFNKKYKNYWCIASKTI